MSYKLRITTVRPTTTVPFYKFDSNIVEYLTATYRDTGIYTVNTTYSSDELTETKTVEFISEAAWNEFNNDPTIKDVTRARKNHNSTHNITRSIVVIH